MDRLFEILDIIKKHNLQVALAHKKRGSWNTYSANDYINYTNAVSSGLLDQGIQHGDRIASITNDRPEWNFIDLGIQQIGAIHVPLNYTASDEEIKFILNETESKIVFVSSRFILTRVKKLLHEIRSVKKIYIFAAIKGANNFEDFIDQNEKQIDYQKIEVRKSKVRPEDIAAILYTSGTTSQPKGVMLSHQNFTSFFLEFPDLIPSIPGANTLLPIPLSHIGSRKTNYAYQFLGMSVYYTDSTDGLIEVLKDVKPAITVMVPLLLEKVHSKIIASINSKKGLQKSIYKYVLNLTQRFKIDKTPFKYRILLNLADSLIYKKWRNRLGGRLQGIVCGGAAIPIHLLKFFWAIKIPVYEIYGMTETSALISVNRAGKTKLGTVGLPYYHVEVKTTNDGELICKGPNIMQGYFKKPELTAEVIDKDGFFHTGDIGVIDDKGFIKITGRKKEIFKTASGEFVSPKILENKLKQSRFVQQIMVVGANKSFLSALIIPEPDHLMNWCVENKIKFEDLKDVYLNSAVVKLFKNEIEKFNSTTLETEKIRKFELLTDKWTVESGELSSFMKLKRNYIEKKYKHEISNFYD